MSERGAEQPPEAVATETDRDEYEQELPERLVRDCLESALLVCDFAAVAEREAEREDADDCVDETSRDKPCASERFKRIGVRKTFAGPLGGTDRTVRP